ncbi:helix-turn-helix domain-containing protein [Paenibacillus chartarius]|uniref:Helix-turn-helix domain-containing protein n=1 Tax=Paenibacillus chartarius TaxID=747481 RepID=A0ABV6DH37_9BACL
MKRFPMMLQLALILFCVMAVPTAILTWYSGDQILRNSERAIAESSLAGLNVSRSLNENALNVIAQNTIRLADTHSFDRIRPYQTFAELNSNFNNVSNAFAVHQDLLNLNKIGDGIYSSFFYLSDSDYVVSTDKGITTLEGYESIDWMQKALAERSGIAGVWYPRKLESGVHVVSYVLPLNRLSTTTRGTIVVNMRESQLENYLRSSGTSEQAYLLMDSNGTIISHNDKSLLLKNGGEEPFIREILDNPSSEGYTFQELKDGRLLYTWSRSELFGWINVNVYSVHELMTKTHTLQRNIIILTAVIIFAGTVLTVFLATWLSKPARELVRTLRRHGKLGIEGRNELAYLNAAFRRMQEEGEDLQRLLNVREQDSRSLAIHNLLQGEPTPQAAEMFPAPYFLVAVVSIDRYRKYVNKNNPETRSYHRYLLISNCESLFPEDVYARCIYQGDGCFVIVINYGQAEYESEGAGIHAALGSIRDEAAALLDHSVTIGVSSPTDMNDTIPDRVVEAMEVIKHRMIAGSGGITYWKAKDGRDKKYIYPANSERRILNFLDHGDLDSIIKELDIIGGEIRSAEYISYDNILFIYNQLAGVTIRHLRENNVSTARIFAGRGNIYAALASIDTLDELEEYLREFYGEIVQYLARTPGEANNYGERIIAYLNEHYRDEIVFEEMAKEIGISYSYMRKIVYEITGISLIDYLNLLRIEKAKQLLVESKLTIAQIALEVGYFNVQSFNRFFRKFEGMPPSSYKAAKSKTS